MHPLLEHAVVVSAFSMNTVPHLFFADGAALERLPGRLKGPLTDIRT